MMKINNFIAEMKSGTRAYSSAYQLILNSYPSFVLSFTGVSLLFIMTALLSALFPFLLKENCRGIHYFRRSDISLFLITMTHAFCWTVNEILKNIKEIFSAGVLARSDAALVNKAMKVLLSLSFKKKKF